MIKRDIDRWTFRVYATDALRIVSENTAVPAASFSDGRLGRAMSMRWAEPDKPPQKEDTRTAEEIIDHISRKLEEVG